MWEGEGKRGVEFFSYHLSSSQFSTQSFYFITPCICARGEVIGRVVVIYVVVVHKKSPDLGI